MTAMRSVCVFCGSLPGALPDYLQAARDLGAALAQRGTTVVYGGGHIGMMGALADSALAAGGRVVGVIPQHLMRPEVAHQGLTELQVVDSMHTRKRMMASRADAFVVLPGGYGTLEEMFEMITWRQLRLHARPVGLVNVAGFFDHLLAFLHQATQQGFIRPHHRRLLTIAPNVDELLDAIGRQTGRPAAPGRIERG